MLDGLGIDQFLIDQRLHLLLGSVDSLQDGRLLDREGDNNGHEEEAIEGAQFLKETLSRVAEVGDGTPDIILFLNDGPCAPVTTA